LLADVIRVSFSSSSFYCVFGFFRHCCSFGRWHLLIYSLAGTAFINAYILFRDIEPPADIQPVNDQRSFREELYVELVEAFGYEAIKNRKNANTRPPSPPAVSHLAFHHPPGTHVHVRMQWNTPRSCMLCSDRRRPERRKRTYWGCEECRIPLCRGTLCWHVWHGRISRN
jgi:hypothetical protein